MRRDLGLEMLTPPLQKKKKEEEEMLSPVVTGTGEEMGIQSLGEFSIKLKLLLSALMSIFD